MKIPVLIFFCLCLLNLETFAQHKKAEKAFQEALSNYRMKNYALALEHIDRAIRLDEKHINSYLLQAEIYQETNHIPQQIKSLNKSLAVGENSPKVYYILAEANYMVGEYRQAEKTLLQIADKGVDERLKTKIEQLLQHCSIAIQLVNDSVEFNPKRLPPTINSIANEYWPCISIDDSVLVFTRLMSDVTPPHEDFYQSSKQRNGGWSEAIPLSELNTTDNEGAQSVTADGKLLFFTACGRNDSFGSCDIYYSRNINGKWLKPVNAGAKVNSTAWDSQPSVAANGKYLYFSSNRKGGKGAKDIWRCKLHGFSKKGVLISGTPENLGDSINTSGNEISPFIHPDEESLYFASDTWDGLGKTDIFLSQFKPDSCWSKARNIGYPINSYRNEQGFIVSANGRTAYYASDRKGSDGVDIYSFDLPEQVRPTPVINDFGKLDELSVGHSIVLKNIFFDYNSSKLLPESYSELNKLVDLFKQFPKLQIEINGHSDNQGSRDYNLKLSTQRAEAVYDYLLNSGISSAQVSFKGYGELMPVASNETEEGRAKNRRTSFKITAIK